MCEYCGNRGCHRMTRITIKIEHAIAVRIARKARILNGARS